MQVGRETGPSTLLESYFRFSKDKPGTRVCVLFRGGPLTKIHKDLVYFQPWKKSKKHELNAD